MRSVKKILLSFDKHWKASQIILYIAFLTEQAWSLKKLLFAQNLFGQMNLLVDHRTVGPPYNEGPKNWQNFFAITRFRYIEVIFQIISIESRQTATERRNCSSEGCLKCVQFHHWFRLH